MVMPVMMGHFLQVGEPFGWLTNPNPGPGQPDMMWRPAAADWLTKCYAWSSGWVDIIKQRMMGLGVWEPRPLVSPIGLPSCAASRYVFLSSLSLSPSLSLFRSCVLLSLFFPISLSAWSPQEFRERVEPPAPPAVSPEEVFEANLEKSNEKVARQFGAGFPEIDAWHMRFPKYVRPLWWEISSSVPFEVSQAEPDFADMSSFFWTSGPK